jgi:hypothetical protein
LPTVIGRIQKDSQIALLVTDALLWLPLCSGKKYKIIAAKVRALQLLEPHHAECRKVVQWRNL